MDELMKMREEFWHTRVDGNPEMWQSLRGAAEALLNSQEDLANTIIEAAQMNTPQGTLLSSYDALGHEYVVPKWAFSNPSDLSTDSKKERVLKAPLQQSPGEPVAVKFRVAPGEKDFTVQTSTGISIEQLKILLQELIEQADEDAKREIPLDAATTQRIVYRGKELKDNETIRSSKIEPDFIVQAYFCRQQSI